MTYEGLPQSHSGKHSVWMEWLMSPCHGVLQGTWEIQVSATKLWWTRMYHKVMWPTGGILHVCADLL